MLEDFRLKIFETVCEQGSFTLAASVLGISQPAVSQNIAELEKALGVVLFERKRGAFALTPEGDKFKSYVTEILYWYRAASSAFSGGDVPAEKASAQIDLGDGKTASVWGALGDIHIKIQ